MRRHMAAQLGSTNLPPLDAVEVRHPTPDDAEVLAVLMLDAYTGTIDADGSETLDDARSEVKGFFAGAAGTPLLDQSFVAVANATPVAAVLVSSYEETPLIAYAMTGAAHKGRGLATALTARALEALRAAGADRVHLWVTAGNTPAETIYERLGFRDVERPDEG